MAATTILIRNGNGAAVDLKAQDDGSGGLTPNSQPEQAGVPVGPGNGLVVRDDAYHFTDQSGTLTTGGAPQQVSPANPARHGFLLLNISNQTLWINETGSAATNASPSWPVLPNAVWPPYPFMNGAPNSAISINGSTDGQAFVAREW